METLRSTRFENRFNKMFEEQSLGGISVGYFYRSGMHARENDFDYKERYSG